jgi:hypothetical protein
MALFNEIQVGRFNRYLQKLLAIKGGPPVPTLSSDLQASYNIDPGAEDRYLLGWDLFGIKQTQPATAAQANILELRNPAGSNVCAVVTAAGDSAALANSIILGLIPKPTTPIDQANLRSTVAWDARGRTASSCILSDASGGAPNLAFGGTALGLAQVDQGVNYYVNLIPTGEEVPLMPGSIMYVLSVTVNQANRPFFHWRERFLEDSERS